MIDRPAELLDEAVYDREPEAGTGIFGREERLEHPLSHRIWHADAIVLDGDVDMLVVSTRRHDDMAALLARFDRVSHEILDDLKGLVAIEVGRERPRIHELEKNAACGRHGLLGSEDTANQFRHIAFADDELRRPREGQK